MLSDFYHSRFCRVVGGCPDRVVKRFGQVSSRHLYSVCLSGELCSCKTDSPVRVKEKI